MHHSPWANLGIIIITALVSLLANFGVISEQAVNGMLLQDWSIPSLFGHMLIHGGWMHLIGNLVFLFAFGNAVCGVINQGVYILIYLASGLLAAATHLAFDNAPALGASGAISGVIGVYLAIYPHNQVTCFWIFMIKVGTTEVAGWGLIIVYFLLDVFGAFNGSDGTAYWAHIGGTVAGFILGIFLLRHGGVHLEDYDHPTILDVFPKLAVRDSSE